MVMYFFESVEYDRETMPMTKFDSAFVSIRDVPSTTLRNVSGGDMNATDGECRMHDL